MPSRSVWRLRAVRLRDLGSHAVILTATRAILVWDSHRQTTRRVLPLLVLAFADTPARRAWALTCGHTGRSGCDKCGVRSVRQGPHGEVYSSACFGGYAWHAPTLTYDINGNWQEGSVLYGGDNFDPATAEPLLITQEKHMLRSVAADEASQDEAEKHPLPAAAANGGTLTADPNSPAERQLSAGLGLACCALSLVIMCDLA